MGQIIQLVIQFRYPLIFLGAIVEGPILTVASGFLLNQGGFNLVPLYLTLMMGDLVGDIGWYYLGYFFAEPIVRRFGHFFSLNLETFEKIKSVFHKKSSIILFVSKITMGFGMAIGTLIAAGAVRISFRIYMFYNVLGEFIYVAALMLLGYYFGFIYNRIAASFKILSLFGLLIVTGIAIYGFSHYIKTKALRKL